MILLKHRGELRLKKSIITTFVIISVIFFAKNITFAGNCHCKKPTTIEEKMNGKTFTSKAGSVSYIVLKINSLKKYKWLVTKKPNPNVALISGPDFESSDKVDIFGITAVKKGSTTLKFKFIKNQKNKTAIKTFTLKVKVVK